MHCSWNSRIAIIFLIFVVVGCRPLALTATSITSASTSTKVPIASRYGTIQIPPVAASGISGIFTATDNGDGSTLLSIQLTPVAKLNPWGIFNTGDCTNGVPVNTRPVFSLPDIKNGQKEETVETEAYISTPGNMILVIYDIAPDGTHSIAACTELGGPIVDEKVILSTPTADCVSLTATSPQVESGTWLAYSATKNGNSDIYIVDVDSVLQGDSPIVKRLTTNPAADFDPTWSPDGMHIAFRSQRDGNDEIYVMNLDGTCQTNLTNDPIGDWSPAWSPDGNRIAFARFFENNSFTDIAVMNSVGTGLTRLTTMAGEYPAWSPDGSQIAFASASDGNYEIYVMNADGSEPTRLTNNPAYDMSPTWSPNGTQIAFDTQRDHYPPAETGIGPEFEIHAITADGSQNIRLTNTDAEDRFPSWGVDGRIAFTSNGSLYIMNADGSHPIKLLDSGSFPDWRPAVP